ncbi:MAG: acyl carrier protein [Planctomycetota bacterium]|nr:acyl carrier protein [Planctomycetota bacterium]
MTSAEISDWLRRHIAGILEKDPSTVDPGATFDCLGLDSLALLGVIGDLATELGIQIETSVLFDHPTIEALSIHLAED